LKDLALSQKLASDWLKISRSLTLLFLHLLLAYPLSLNHSFLFRGLSLQIIGFARHVAS
jgi:hypothetical protein